MKSKDIQIGDKTIQIKELKYLDLADLSNIQSVREKTKKLMELSGVPLDIIDELNASDGNKLIAEINSLNSFGDFTNASQKTTS